jgi:flagellar P-ring protein precursor FlgI
MVSAQLPVNARPGQTIDVTVSALDDAESLAGGELIITPLQGVDNQYYGTAAGMVSTNAFDFGGEAASVQKNHPTSGRIPNGLTVEKAVAVTDIHPHYINLLLRRSDIQTAKRVVEAINRYAPNSAAPISHGVIKVTTPVGPHERLNFLAAVEMLEIVPDRVARIVINERTGTVVIGDNVRISGVSIAHGNLSVTTAETPEVSQPLPRSRGETVVVPRTDVEVVEEKGQVQVIEPTATIADLTDALNALGVTPRDLSSVFQMLKDQGALHAELELK